QDAAIQYQDHPPTLALVSPPKHRLPSKLFNLRPDQRQSNRLNRRNSNSRRLTRPHPQPRIRPISTLTSTSNSRTKLTLPNVLHIPRNNPSEQRRTPSSQLRSTRRINRNASALTHPIP